MAVNDKLDEARARANVVQSYGSLLTPIIVVIATFWLNQTLDAARKADAKAALLVANQKQCIETNLDLAKAGGGEGDQRLQREAVVGALAPFVRKFCDDAGIRIPETTRAVLAETGKTATEITVASAAQAAVQPGQTVAVVTGGAKASAQSLATTPSARGMRLYIQISSEDQRPVAQALVEALRGRTLTGRALLMPGIERVATYPSAPELRCLKSADCQAAPALAAYISQNISGQKVTVRDLSATYQANPRVAEGSYELWFGPPTQQIVVTPVLG